MDFFNMSEDEHDSSGFVMRSNEREANNNFSKSLIGGYTKGSVERYIQEMKINARQMQENIEFQLQELILEKQSLSQENTLLKSQISDAEMRSQELDGDMLRVSELNQEQERIYLKQQEELLAEINALQAQLEEVIRDRNKIEQALEALSQEQASLVQENEFYKHEVQHNPEQDKTIDSLNLHIQALEVQIETSESKHEEYEILLRDRKEELANLIEDIDQLREENDALRQSEQEADETINSLESAMEESLKSINGLNETIKNLEEINKALSLKEKFQETEKDRLEKTLSHLQDKIEQQKQSMNSVQDSVESPYQIPHRAPVRNPLPISDAYDDEASYAYDAKRLKEENMSLREELKQEILDKFRIEKCLSDDLKRLQIKTDSLINERDDLKYQYESKRAQASRFEPELGLRYQRTLKEQQENETRKKHYEIAKKLEAIQLKRKKLEDSISSFDEEEMTLRYLLEE